MANLNNLENPQPTVTTFPGVIVNTGGGILGVNVNGNILPARWADPLVVAAGDTVLVEISGGATGQGAAFVKCRLTAAPRPGTGTVKTVPASSPTITVTGTDGTDYTATFASSYTPTVGDNVILAWNASIPTVLGNVGSTAAPPTPATPVTPPPPPPQTGQNSYPATDSDTIWPAGGWGSWAGGGGHVYQGGSSYGGPVYGAWFYGGTTAELVGRTITRIQFRVPSRRNIGSYNSPITMHIYAHTSPTKPGGDVSRVAGPFDVTIQPGSGGGYIDISTSFAAALQGGGGISIAGEPYAGFNGRTTQPDSGILIIDWTR